MVEPIASILDLCDLKVVRRNSQRADPVGKLLAAILAAGDPDTVFREAVRPMFRGFTRAHRRLTIQRLSIALGIPRETMKQYLRGAGVVNEMD